MTYAVAPSLHNGKNEILFWYCNKKREFIAKGYSTKEAFQTWINDGNIIPLPKSYYKKWKNNLVNLPESGII